MFAATPDTFAIDHHRACNRETTDPGARHAGQQFGGAGIVGRCIIRQIADGDAEADLGGEMKHSLDAAERPIDRRGVTHIGRLQLDAGGRGPHPPGVNVRAQ